VSARAERGYAAAAITGAIAEDPMRRHLSTLGARAVRIALLGSLFGAGYLLGAVTQPTAEAQVEELGKKAMEAAGESGGTLGSVAELGTSITEMREHVAALSENLDKLDKIKAALGGG
jgi:hypothetical protein